MRSVHGGPEALWYFFCIEIFRKQVGSITWQRLGFYLLWEVKTSTHTYPKHQRDNKYQFSPGTLSARDLRHGLRLGWIVYGHHHLILCLGLYQVLEVGEGWSLGCRVCLVCLFCRLCVLLVLTYCLYCVYCLSYW